MTKSIYLDFAAATPVDERVLRAMEPYFSKRFYNPSGLTLASKAVNRDLEIARQSVAVWLGCRLQEIVFTAGGTESINLAIQGVMQAFPGKNIVISAIEHDAVRKPAKRYINKVAEVGKTGLINLEMLANKIDDKTVMVSVMYANNEIGTIQPIKEISKLLKKVRQSRLKNGNKLPLYLHSDACQAGAYLDLHVDKLGLDMLTLNGGKMYGPKQSGVLYIRTGTKLLGQIIGGGQENSLRGGTENVALTVGFARALDLAQTNRKQESARLSSLQKEFIKRLEQEIPKVTINGSKNHRLPNNVHLSIHGIDNERVLMELDEQGILCAVGSACSASSDEPSHVLKAIGLRTELIRSSLRFSMGNTTTIADVKTTVNTLKSIISK